jgi:DnaK suppressor protein
VRAGGLAGPPGGEEDDMAATKAAESKAVKKAKPTAGTTARTGKVPQPASSASSAKKAPATTAKRSTSKSPAPTRASRPSAPPAPTAATGVKKTSTKAQTAVRKAATNETVKSSVTSTSRTTEKKKAAAAAKAPARTQKASPPPSPAGPERNGAKPASRKVPARPPAGPYAADEKFLAEQRHLLESERTVYQNQASDLKAEADSLAEEREPGDVQFDEESGEGGTVTVDRERDLALSAQALAAVEEINAALGRIDDKTYGACERCQQPIPKPRLKALPFARLCVACKSGGLSRR